MTRNELNRFQAALTARVAELERVTRRRDGITVERNADQLDEIQVDEIQVDEIQVDEIQAASQRTVAVYNLDREFNQLREARAALRRIQEGSYGTCHQCEDDIHPKRLAAVPWALFCIRRQEAVDRNLGKHEAASRDLLGRAA
jgi:DnaK suppressor protein